MAKVTLLQGAEEDLQQSVDWYSMQSQRAAANFEIAFSETIDCILKNPELGAPLDGNVRFRKVPRFPFHIVYRCNEFELIIGAVAHGSRRRNYWKDRW